MHILHPEDPSTPSGGGGTILKTIDGGATWFPLASGTSFDLSSICFPSMEPLFVYNRKIRQTPLLSA
jgi:hypothetical protein